MEAGEFLSPNKTGVNGQIQSKLDLIIRLYFIHRICKDVRILGPLGTFAKRRTAKQLINNYLAVPSVIPTGFKPVTF